MSHPDRQFIGAIPEIYDRLMVPMLFEPYAEDLARRVVALSPSRVLETAAGTGVVTRAVVAGLPEHARCVATDLNPAMLDRAAARQGDAGHVEWRAANALDLPFDDDTFDVVWCQFGVMFFDDRVAGYREAKRVLRPGGRFLFNVWDRIDKNDFAQATHVALGRCFETDPPQFMARTPHGYHDAERIRADVLAAGYSTVELTTLSATSRADHPLTVATAFCQGTPLRREIEARDPQGLDRVTCAVAEHLEKQCGLGPLQGAMSAHVVMAVA